MGAITTPIRIPADHFREVSALLAALADPKASATRLDELQSATSAHRAAEADSTAAFKRASDQAEEARKLVHTAESALAEAAARNAALDEREREIAAGFQRLQENRERLAADQAELARQRNEFESTVAAAESAARSFTNLRKGA